MAAQIAFFRKNKLDISNPNADLTASQGDDYVDYVRNRNNDSAWVTTDSEDADNTYIEVDFADQRDIDNIFLVKHNFAAYTIQYWNGSTYVNFSTPISVSGNTADFARHSFTLVSTTKIKLIVTATIVPDSDKRLFQLIATELIGQLTAYPVIKNPNYDKNIANTQMLSGKSNVVENVGGFSCALRMEHWKTQADLDVVDELYSSSEGFLVWLCGGDESQFEPLVRPYRKQDIFLMKCANDFSPEFMKGLYNLGTGIEIRLVEVVD